LSVDLSFSRLVPSSDGGSRFDTVAIPVTLQNFAPPARPFGVSPLSPASQCGFLHLPAGWVGQMHPSPIRMWIFVLEGEMHFEASNGESRHITPGSALLLEDTVGRGHLSRVLGSLPVTLAVVRLPEANAANLRGDPQRHGPRHPAMVIPAYAAQGAAGISPRVKTRIEATKRRSRSRLQRFRECAPCGNSSSTPTAANSRGSLTRRLPAQMHTSRVRCRASGERLSQPAHQLQPIRLATPTRNGKRVNDRGDR
jgi:hypothetical protein